VAGGSWATGGSGLKWQEALGRLLGSRRLWAEVAGGSGLK